MRDNLDYLFELITRHADDPDADEIHTVTYEDLFLYHPEVAPLCKWEDFQFVEYCVGLTVVKVKRI